MDYAVIFQKSFSDSIYFSLQCNFSFVANEQASTSNAQKEISFPGLWRNRFLVIFSLEFVLIREIGGQNPCVIWLIPASALTNQAYAKDDSSL